MDIDLFNLTIKQKFALAGIVVVVVGFFFLQPYKGRYRYWDAYDEDDPAWLRGLYWFYRLFR